jgi:hypothetical protein
MSQDFHSGQKICGSCMFWGGQRESIQNNKKAKCEMKSAQCLGKHKPQTKMPNSSVGCGDWVLWGLLKK